MNVYHVSAMQLGVTGPVPIDLITDQVCLPELQSDPAQEVSNSNLLCPIT